MSRRIHFYKNLAARCCLKKTANELSHWTFELLKLVSFTLFRSCNVFPTKWHFCSFPFYFRLSDFRSMHTFVLCIVGMFSRVMQMLQVGNIELCPLPTFAQYFMTVSVFTKAAFIHIFVFDFSLSYAS